MENKLPRIRFQIFKHLIDHCTLLNTERKELLRIAGVDENFLKKNIQYAPLAPFERMVTYIYENTNDPLLLLKFFLKSDISSIGPLGLLMNLSANLEDAINTFYKYKDINGDLGDFMSIKENREYIFLQWEYVTTNYNFIRCAIEYKCAWWANFITLIGDGSENYLKYIYFEHEILDPAVQEFYSSFFGCPVFFGQKESVIAISKKALNIPLRTANAELYLSVESYIINVLKRYRRETKVTDKVKSLIYLQLHKGSVSREIIADKMGINVRTLTRKLYAEGNKYSSILEEVRIEIAKDYLKNSNYSIVYISKALGFFTSNAFITWFKSLTGQPPKKYRENFR